MVVQSLTKQSVEPFHTMTLSFTAYALVRFEVYEQHKAETSFFRYKYSVLKEYNITSIRTMCIISTIPDLFFLQVLVSFRKGSSQIMRCKVFTPNSTGPESRGIFNMPRAGVVGFICDRKHIHLCEHFIVNHLTMRAIVRSFQHSQWWICYRRKCRAHPNTQIGPVGKLGYNTTIIRLVLSS